MKPIVWIEIHCDNCGDVIGWNYHNAESISKLKKAAKGWVYNQEYGNLCPECKKVVEQSTNRDPERHMIPRKTAQSLLKNPKIRSTRKI